MSERYIPAELPYLSTLLDERLAGTILADGPFRGWMIADCRLEQIKYRPGRNCLLTYHLQLATKGGMLDVPVYLMACRPGESHQVHAAAAKTATVQTPFSQGLWHLDQLDSVLWIFPNDRKLGGIAALNDPDSLSSEVASQIGGSRQRGKIEIIRYVAERSCTVRLRLEDGATVSYGKFYRPGESDPAWNAIGSLWQSKSCRSGSLTIPEPLIRLDESESVWLREVRGVPLERKLPEDLTGEWMIRTGRTIAELHKIGATIGSSSLPVIVETERRQKLENAIELLAMVNGGQRVRLAELATKLARKEPRNRPGNLAVLHGDLHLKNMIALESGAIALIDLDNLCLGDPLIDLGSFIAHLYYWHYWSREAGGSRPELLVEQLLAGYFEAAGEPLDEQSLRWQIAAALIGERAVRCITRLKPGGRPLVDWLIDLAAQTVEGL